jgi:dihydroflavonol-4-reductase
LQNKQQFYVGKKLEEDAIMQNTIYLVTGATGFLGSNICKQLIERGETVRAFAMPNDKAVKFVPKEVEVFAGDLCNEESLEYFLAVPKGMESIVIHCASMVTVNPDYNQKLMDINVGGTKNVINACLRHKECRKMVYVSSTGAIPELPKGQAIKEAGKFDPALVVGCYSQSKAMATQAVLDAVKEKNLNACVVHPSGILGPGDHAISETTGTIIQILNGEMPAGLQGSFNLCDVRDLAYGCIMAADKGRKGQCYIFSNKEVTLKELCRMLSKESGCKPLKIYLPLGIANFLAKILEKQAKKTGKKPLITTFSVYNLARNNAFDCSKAGNELGYKTRSYEETIRDEVAWLKAEGKIKTKVITQDTNEKKAA